LYLIAAYLAVLGILFAFAPRVAQRITATTHDPTLSLLYGQYTLTFAVVAFLTARENEAAGKLSLVILMLTAGHVAVFGYLLLTGAQAFFSSRCAHDRQFRLNSAVVSFQKNE
jgi:hypothetical protein